MRERVSQQVPSIESLMIKTFHSFGAYILRQCHEAVGRTKILLYMMKMTQQN